MTPGELSADGRWRWDGAQWVPAGATMTVPPPILPTEYTAPTNQLAIIALVAAMLSWVLLPVFGALVAIVTGHIARGQIRRSGESGKGLALAALVIGYVHLVVVVVAAIVWVILVGGFLFAWIGAGSR